MRAQQLVRGSIESTWLSKMFFNGPLGRRAWCLQERQLSPRIIHVFHDLTWIGSAIPRSTSGASITTALVVAISAIALKLQPFLSNYIAVIWENDIYGLVWYCDNFFRLEEPCSETALMNSDLTNHGEYVPSSVDDVSYDLNVFCSTEKGSLSPGGTSKSFWHGKTTRRPGKDCTNLAEASFQMTAHLTYENLGSDLQQHPYLVISGHAFRNISILTNFCENKSASTVSFDQRPLNIDLVTPEDTSR